MTDTDATRMERYAAVRHAYAVEAQARAAAEREKDHQAGIVVAVKSRLVMPWRDDPEAAIRDIAKAVGYYVAPRAALASRGEPAAHAAGCDCLACDPDPVLDSPLAAPDDWATVEAARRAIKDALWESPTPTGLEGIPHAQSDTIIAWFAAREARLRASDQAKTEALLRLSDYNEGEPCWCPDHWWERRDESGVHSKDCDFARAALAAAAAAPEETT